MAQAATPGGPGLPCSSEQALALYQLLFRRPAGLGQLQAALRQVQEGQDCPLELALPAVLLEMEWSRRAQEQLLWDLELLTGAGLGLFWPPWRFRCQRHQAQDTRSQRSQPLGRMGGDSRQQGSRLYASLQAEDFQHQNHQLTEAEQEPGPLSALDLDEARSDTDPTQEGPGIPEKATPGCLQEMNPTTSRHFEEPENSAFKGKGSKGPGQGLSQDLAQREKSQAGPTIQQLHSPTLRSPQEGKLSQETPEPSGLTSQGLPAPQDPPKEFCLGLNRERLEPQKLLLLDPPQSLREAVPGRQKGEASQRENKEVPPSQGEKPQESKSREDPRGQREGAPQGENPEAPESQTGNGPKCLGEEASQGQEMKAWQAWEGHISPALEVAQGEATAQLLGDGDPLGLRRDFPRSLGEQSPPCVGRENPGPRGRSTQRVPSRTEGQSQESAVMTLGYAQEEEWAPVPGPGDRIRATWSSGDAGQPELPATVPGGGRGPVQQEVGRASFPGALGERWGGPGGLPASKAAWPATLGVSAAQQDSALRRLLELHGAARTRRRQDREQQRLRVLERLRIAGNRRCRVHPLGLPSGPAQLRTQDDAAGWRRALREQLDQVHRERAGRLRDLGGRNTQKFQELLWPAGAEDPVPGE